MLTIIVLSAIVGSLAISMSTEIRLARNTEYSAQMEWMGRSGIELAKYALANKCAEQKSFDALNQFWAGGTSPCSNGMDNFPLKDVPLGPGKITVTITDCERKWNINAVCNPQNPQKGILHQALAEVGVTDEEQAETITDSILDWINPNESSGFNGAKSDYYTHLNPPYYCKNGPMDDISELLLIKGITPEIYWGSNSTNHPVSAYQQHGGGTFTPTVNQSGAGFHSSDQPQYPVGLVELFDVLGGLSLNRPSINLNTASLKTMQLIPDIDEATAAHIIQERAGPDGQDGTDDDVPLTSPGEIASFMGSGPGTAQIANFVGVQSYVFKVQVVAEIGDYKRNFYGVLSRGGNGGQTLNCIKFYWE